MNNHKIKLNNINDNDIPKYKKIVNAIIESIEINKLKVGDSIPSINEFSETHKVSRDTVFKAFTILKNEGVIQVNPNRGYFIAGNNIKVLLLLDNFKAFKEVLYEGIIRNLPNNIVIDLQFHHYNIKNFKSMLNTNNGRYYKYIVKGFDNPQVSKALSKIDNDKLLLIDWDVCSKSNNNYVFQDFGESLYNSLKGALDLFKKYEAVHFIYPEFTYHPKESVLHFKNFCKAYGLKYSVITNSKEFVVQKHIAYISVNDRILCEFLNQCRSANLEPGKDTGILSYNDTPMKKFIYKGISVISTDFKELGAKAAQFINGNEKMQYYVPTKLILRDSL